MKHSRMIACRFGNERPPCEHSKTLLMVQTCERKSMIERRNQDEPRVLSFAQEALWYVHQLVPSSPVYNVAFFSRLRGDLNVPALEEALSAVVHRHETLRTVFLVSQGAPTPFPLKRRRVELKQTDLRDVPEPQREADLKRLVEIESARPFYLSRDLMLRPFLFRIAEQEYVFLHVAPHIVFEGGSLNVLYRDLAAFYDQLVSGREPYLPDLPFEYSDFALWQRMYLQGRRLETLNKYWKEQLRDTAVLDLPVDFTRPGIHTQRGSRYRFAMPPELMPAANATFGKVGTTSFRGLFAAFAAFLYCYTGSTDICVSSPFTPVWYPKAPDLIGFFVNTTAVRVDLSGLPPFSTLLARVERAVRRAMTHCDLPYSKVVELVHPMRDPSRMPLTQVNFRAPGQPNPALQLSGISGTPAEIVDNGSSKFDLALEVESSAGQICQFEYCTDLFKPDTIHQMEKDFKSLLAALITQLETPMNEVQAVREIRRRVGSRPAILTR